MLDQIVGIIKNTTITTLGLVTSLFGMGDIDFLEIQDADLAEFSQASIVESLREEVDEVTEATEIKEEVEAIKTIETVKTTEEIEDKSDIEYFDKEDLPVAVFARPDSSLVQPTQIIATTTEIVTTIIEPEELITIGEEKIEKVRAINPIKTTKTKKEVDTTLILSVDLDKYDTKLQISEIKEDDENFYVAYQYLTLAVENRIWKEVIKEKNISITKKILKGKDLGLYLSEELSEVIDTEIIYLKEVQEILKLKKVKIKNSELDQIETRTTVSDYDTLIGKVLDIESSDFENYEPTVQEEIITDTSVVSEIVINEIEEKDKKEEIIDEPIIIEDNTTSSGVIDNQAPLVVIQGNNPALVQVGASYVDLGAIVTDNVSKGLGVKISGDVVDTKIKGSYFIIYTATDEAGNTATATREVIVYDYGLIPEIEEKIEPVSELSEEVVDEIVEEIVEEIKEEVVSDESKKTKKTKEPKESKESKKDKIITQEETILKDSVEEEKIIETVIDVTINTLDNSAEIVQETVDVMVENASEVIGKSVENVTETTTKIIEVAEESVEAVVEVTTEAVDTSIETIQETINNVTEATTELAEEVTAMMLSIDFKNLLGNVSSSMDFGLGDKFLDILDKTGLTIYENINGFIEGISNILNNTGLDLIKESYNKITKSLSVVSSKVTQRLSLAGIKYSSIDVDEIEKKESKIVDQKDSEKLVKTNEGSDIKKLEFLKNKVIEIKEIMQEGLKKTLNFLEENKPNIKNG